MSVPITSPRMDTSHTFSSVNGRSSWLLMICRHPSGCARSDGLPALVGCSGTLSTCFVLYPDRLSTLAENLGSALASSVRTGVSCRKHQLTSPEPSSVLSSVCCAMPCAMSAHRCFPSSDSSHSVPRSAHSFLVTRSIRRLSLGHSYCSSDVLLRPDLPVEASSRPPPPPPCVSSGSWATDEMEVTSDSRPCEDSSTPARADSSANRPKLVSGSMVSNGCSERGGEGRLAPGGRSEPAGGAGL